MGTKRMCLWSKAHSFQNHRVWIFWTWSWNFRRVDNDLKHTGVGRVKLCYLIQEKASIMFTLKKSQNRLSGVSPEGHFLKKVWKALISSHFLKKWSGIYFVKEAQSSASTRKRVVEVLLFCSFFSRVEVASILLRIYIFVSQYGTHRKTLDISRALKKSDLQSRSGFFS